MLPRYRTAYFSTPLVGVTTPLTTPTFGVKLWTPTRWPGSALLAWVRLALRLTTTADLTGQAGQRFRDEFLSRGDSREAALSYQRFAGRKPSLEHLLKRRGLD